MADGSSSKPESDTTGGVFPAGSVIFDKFRVIELIGSGGMGLVYRALQLDLEKEVALKVLNTRYANKAQSIRFQNEARAVSKFSHRNIAQIFDFGISKDEQAYMVMELIDGVSLERLLTIDGQLTLAVFFPLFIQLCDALETAHSSAVVHRDIKPANIMLVESEGRGENAFDVKVLDFGIAKNALEDNQVTVAGAVIGSPLYLSPEMARSGKVSPQSDLYSMGCVMFKCLTGRAPFSGESAIEVISKHLSEEPLLPHSSMPESVVSDRLSALVLQLMAKNPEERPPSAAFVKSLLESLHDEYEKANDQPDIDFDAEPDVEVAKTDDPFIMTKSRIAFAAVFVLFTVLMVYRIMDRPVPVKGLTGDVAPTTVAQDFKGALNHGKRLNDLPAAVAASRDFLSLSQQDLGDDDLSALRNSQSIRTLDLRDNKRLTDRGLEYVNHLPLKHLYLDQTLVSTLNPLRVCAQLVDVSLAHSNVNDQSLGNLSRTLNTVSLGWTDVTGKGVRRLLNRAPGLKHIDLTGCKNISKEEISALQKEFPRASFVALPE